MKVFTLLAAVVVSVGLAGCASPSVVTKPFKAEARFSGDFFSKEQVDVQPRAIKRSPVYYPQEFRRAEIAGRAVVVFIIDTEGVPREVQCVEATDPAFAKAAVNAAARWRFTPAQKAGKPVASQATQLVEFNISD